MYPVKIVLRDEWPDDPQIGDAWYSDIYGDSLFAAEYRGKGLRALCVQMSPSHSFMIYGRASDPPHGWTVTGTVEDGTLTLTPSILINRGTDSEFHGYITKGMVTL